MPSQDSSSSSSLALAQAQEAAQCGDRRLAHAICVQLTADEPANEQAWLWRAGTAESQEESIAALSQVLTLNPANAAARQGLYEAMQGLLRHDAFLAYLGETDDLYQVRTKQDFRFAHPKDRAAPEPFPPLEPPPAQAAQRWLVWALIGLLPAGLGALLCAPLAALAALKLLRHHSTSGDRQRALVILGLAVVVWLIGAVFVLLFILHLG